MTATNGSVLALDVGGKRIGVAAASLIARLPRPVTTLNNDADFVGELQKIIQTEAASSLVVGLPRGLQGQETDQTRIIREFVDNLRRQIDLPIEFQDEAVTSQHAEAELRSRGEQYTKGDIDVLAAVYILDDWLAEHQEAADETL
jgi:putative holliday junction resolvase